MFTIMGFILGFALCYVWATAKIKKLEKKDNE